MIDLSVLDLVPVREGGTVAAAMAGTPMELPEEDIERHERSGPESERLAASIAASAP